MFKILELKNADTAVPAEVGHGYSTREQASVAIKKHLKTFRAARSEGQSVTSLARDCSRPR